jgi:hypothetical protein
MLVAKTFEERLSAWKTFRDQLDSEDNPIQLAIDFWNSVPRKTRNIDPYDPTTWPDPWQMIEENSYCDYTAILAVAYTLMLTEKCQDWHYEIRVGLDRSQSKLYYMLLANDYVIGFDNEKSVHINDLPENIHIEQTHVLSDQF